MALIIPDSNKAVLALQNLFRLNVPLESPGDIFESVSSAEAFAIGPQSDISSVQVTYFDETVLPTRVNQILISPDRWFLGSINARNEAVYPNSLRPGRILISPADIYDPAWTPLGFDPDRDTIVWNTPVIDVLQYFTPPSAFTPQRSDKTFQFQYIEPPVVPGALASTYIAIPAYGRKSGFMSFRNQDPSEQIDVTVQGVQLSPSAAPGIIGAYEATIQPTLNILANSSNKFIYKSGTHGLFDLLVIELTNYRGNAMPITVTLSDDPQ